MNIINRITSDALLKKADSLGFFIRETEHIKNHVEIKAYFIDFRNPGYSISHTDKNTALVYGFDINKYKAILRMEDTLDICRNLHTYYKDIDTAQRALIKVIYYMGKELKDYEHRQKIRE